ncbi:hypothetical protein A2Y26_05200 [candidate division CPR2 bacterium GWD2_39_7]|nr:MAG: hypothetical protein A2Y27_00380 [candidate division CPR2 bacterium GWD1_39_7]OGB72240.1 MAG: hypothetical protein A2Y26_05200 [candidate division CPR2 bacterium GWD2_39_7]
MLMKKITPSWLISIFLIIGCLAATTFLIKKELTKPNASKLMGSISAEELKAKIDRKDFFYLIDGRGTTEYTLEHIPGAVNITPNEVPEKTKAFTKDSEIVVYCEFRCGIAKEIKDKLASLDFNNVRIYNEGVPGWQEKGYKTAKGDEKSLINLSARYSTAPLILIAGLTDGINPCAIGMLLFLLGYLIIFAERPEKSLGIGVSYIATTYIAYFLLGLVLLNSLYSITGSTGFTLISKLINFLIIGILFGAAVINIKDYFAYGKGLSLQIPKSVRGKLQKVVEMATIPSTIILAFLVTFFESPCSLPVYVGTLKILRETYSSVEALIYLGLYNFMFVLPLIILLIVVLRGEQMVFIKEWEHKNKKKMKLAMGIAQLIIAGWILVM